MQELEKLKYPIGKYNPSTIISAFQIQAWIEELALFPAELIEVAKDLNEEDLELAYRKGGWTVRQVINHLADSHINAYTRVHLTLTEEKPHIRPYLEDKWAELVDGRTGDIQLSITILKAIHARLVVLLKTLIPHDFERTYFHPEVQQEFTLAYLLGNYAWHGKHHLAQIKSTMK